MLNFFYRFFKSYPFYFYLQFIFIFVLCVVHFGLHYLDFSTLQKAQNFFENHLILTSYDAYFYAKGARDFLEILNHFSLSLFLESMQKLSFLSLLGGFFAKVTSLNFILGFGSVLFSVSYGVVLYYLVEFLLKQSATTLQQEALKSIAFLASLIAILLPSFYQRVGAGYFDTDMLLLSLPLLCIYFLLRFYARERLVDLILFGIFGYLAVNWHNGIQNVLLLGFLGFVFLEIFLLKSLRFLPKTLQIISIFLIILTPSKLCFTLLILAFFVLSFRRNLWIIAFCALCYALTFGLFDPLIAQIQAYIFGSTQHAKLYTYTSVVTKILETSPANLNTLIERSGGIFIALFACFGLLLLFIFGLKVVFFGRANKDFLKQKNLIVGIVFLLPFFALGILSLRLGVRFSLFLGPIIALGCSFGLLYLLARGANYFNAIFLCAFVGVGVFIATLNYKIPQSILAQSEIQAFKDLDSKLSNNDFIFSWWDYGYALRYFTKAQVLLDGGRHSGAINFPIATMLCSDSKELFFNLSYHLAQSLQKLPQNKWNESFEVLLQNTSMDSFLKAQKQGFSAELLSGGAQIYWVLPLRILPLVANICSFSYQKDRLGEFAFLEAQKKPKNFATNHRLTQVNFKENLLLLSEGYLKSNIITMLLFDAIPKCVEKSGEVVKIFHLKDGKCVESLEQ